MICCHDSRNITQVVAGHGTLPICSTSSTAPASSSLTPRSKGNGEASTSSPHLTAALPLATNDEYIRMCCSLRGNDQKTMRARTGSGRGEHVSSTRWNGTLAATTRAAMSSRVSGTDDFSLERPVTGDLTDPRPEQQQNLLPETISSAIAWCTQTHSFIQQSDRPTSARHCAVWPFNSPYGTVRFRVPTRWDTPMPCTTMEVCHPGGTHVAL